MYSCTRNASPNNKYGLSINDLLSCTLNLFRSLNNIYYLFLNDCKISFWCILYLAALSLEFCFDMRFFSGYCSSHRRFNLNIYPVPLLHSSSAVVTSHLFSSSICWQGMFYLSLSIWDSFISSYVVSLKCSKFVVGVDWLKLILIYISHKRFWICTGHQSI